MHQNCENKDVLVFHEHLQNQEAGQWIQKDDIVNLRIDLETHTPEEFIAILD